MKKQKNKGISLIVLVITIVVMIVLAATVIISLSSNNIVDKANEAVDTTNLKQVQQAATLLWADAYAGGARTQADLEDAVLDGLEEIENIDLDNYTVTVTETGVTVEKTVILTPSERYYGVANVVPTNPEYFTYDYDKTTMTATLTGVNYAYVIFDYYTWDNHSMPYTAGIEGKSGNAITDIVVPYETTDAEGNTYTITKIGESTFGQMASVLPVNNGFTNYTLIVLPNTITDIDDYAFKGGKDIRNIIIPASVENIGYAAFDYCTGIVNVYYRGSKAEWDNIAIGNKNSNLTNANKVYNYTGMLDVVGGEEPGVDEDYENLTPINASYFEYDYDNNTMTATITGVKDEYSGTTYYTASNGNQYQTKTIVDDGGNIVSQLVIPRVTFNDYGKKCIITSIGDGAFENNSTLTSVVVPNTITSIETGAFSKCEAITYVKISARVTSIGSNVFTGCCNLNTIVLGSGLTSIKAGAFFYLPKLTTVYYTGTQEQWNAITIADNNTALTSATITYNYTGTAE